MWCTLTFLLSNFVVIVVAVEKEATDERREQSSLAFHLILFSFVNHFTKEMRHSYESYEFEKFNCSVSLHLSTSHSLTYSVIFFLSSHIEICFDAQYAHTLPCAVCFYGLQLNDHFQHHQNICLFKFYTLFLVIFFGHFWPSLDFCFLYTSKGSKTSKTKYKMKNKWLCRISSSSSSASCEFNINLMYYKSDMNLTTTILLQYAVFVHIWSPYKLSPFC